MSLLWLSVGPWILLLAVIRGLLLSLIAVGVRRHFRNRDTLKDHFFRSFALFFAFGTLDMNFFVDVIYGKNLHEAGFLDECRTVHRLFFRTFCTYLTFFFFEHIAICNMFVVIPYSLWSDSSATVVRVVSGSVLGGLLLSALCRLVHGWLMGYLPPKCESRRRRAHYR